MDLVDSKLEELERRVAALEAPPVLKVKLLRPNAKAPQYMTAGANALDLVACIDVPITLDDRTVLVDTGIAIELPPGYEAQVRPRGSTPLRGLCVANSPGTVDEDYRGEIKVMLRAISATELVTVTPGERIAQLVITRAQQAQIEVVDELSSTARGAGGFGSTGR